MAKTSSKSAKPQAKVKAKISAKANFWQRQWRRLKLKVKGIKNRIHEARAKHLHFHKSFRRTYREDYRRETPTPGLLSHAMLTFKTIFQHWRTFLPFIALMVTFYILLVGLMSEDFYLQFQDSIEATSTELASGRLGNFARAGLLLASTITSGGLDAGMGEAQTVFAVILFMVIWLVTIYLLRHFLAGEKPRLRDGLYNALGPLLSTLAIIVVIFVQAIPLMLVIITYSAALATGFLSTPFYALVYFIFAALMILMSGYLLSSSLIALVAVTAPGIYPLVALTAASDLMASRRMRLVLRVLYLIIVVVFIYLIVMLPIIFLDLVIKGAWEWLAGLPIVPFFMLIVTCFVFIYISTYLYLYYRWLLDYKEK